MGKQIGDWLGYRIPPKNSRSVDEQMLYFGRSGEFSPEADLNFQEHLRRLNRLNNNPVIKRLNGRRIKEIERSEGLRYWRT